MKLQLISALEFSILTRWVRQARDAEEPAEDQADLWAQLKRLRKQRVSCALIQDTPLRIRVFCSAVDLGLEGLDLSDDFIEGWCVTDDHFPHPGIVIPKSGSEFGVWG